MLVSSGTASSNVAASVFSILLNVRHTHIRCRIMRQNKINKCINLCNGGTRQMTGFRLADNQKLDYYVVKTSLMDTL